MGEGGYEIRDHGNSRYGLYLSPLLCHQHLRNKHMEFD